MKFIFECLSFSKGTERNRNCGAEGERETKIGNLLDLGEH
uniref:Uncharacterized protein n=1 Tax=Anopheles atroparvus TaxID=41427 RepID=A0AAG5DUI5_ANOAO